MRNFSDIFTKDMIYDNIKSHKKQDFTLSLEDTFLEKNSFRVHCDRTKYLIVNFSFNIFHCYRFDLYNLGSQMDDKNLQKGLGICDVSVGILEAS